MIYGYSTYIKADFELQSQTEVLNRYGCAKILLDQFVGDKKNHKNLKELMGKMIPGDELIIYKLSNSGLNINQLCYLVKHLRKNGIHFRSILDGVDTKSENGTYFLNFIESISDLEKTEKITEKTMEKNPAIEPKIIADSKKSKRGRKPKFSYAQIMDIKSQHLRKVPIKHIAKEYNVTIATIWNYIKKSYGEDFRYVPEKDSEKVNANNVNFEDIAFKDFKIVRTKKKQNTYSGEAMTVNKGQMCLV
ncbi:hypothetical protein LCGC14_0405690 [marine sediment metagenome]|uniref:Resolvase/invertase-type recombinase catalytic domain-containing protein n=1 Tax=marine sediment metagenome TaxID=412755 RepID=A0A0F9SVM9_9ZZZZ|nr:recombinase family protein [archaeon]